jgi:hypothetical protein
MAIEDYVNDIDLHIDNYSWYEYRKELYDNIKDWNKRYCIECGGDMKISWKWNLYCSRICWDKEVEPIKENIDFEESMYEKF